MDTTSARRLVIPIVVLVTLASGATAQAPDEPLESWTVLVEACRQRASEGAHVCPCAATDLLQRCEQLGFREGELASCAAMHLDEWLPEAIDACQSVRALRTAPPVPTPRARAIAAHDPQARTTSASELFRTTFDACVASAAQDPGLGARYVDHTCACASTFALGVCAPIDRVPEAHALACLESARAEIAAVASACARWGALVSARRVASPPAPASTWVCAAPTCTPPFRAGAGFVDVP